MCFHNRVMCNVSFAASGEYYIILIFRPNENAFFFNYLPVLCTLVESVFQLLQSPQVFVLVATCMRRGSYMTDTPGGLSEHTSFEIGLLTTQRWSRNHRRLRKSLQKDKWMLVLEKKQKMCVE